MNFIKYCLFVALNQYFVANLIQNSIFSGPFVTHLWTVASPNVQRQWQMAKNKIYRPLELICSPCMELSEPIKKHLIYTSLNELTMFFPFSIFSLQTRIIRVVNFCFCRFFNLTFSLHFILFVFSIILSPGFLPFLIGTDEIPNFHSKPTSIIVFFFFKFLGRRWKKMMQW